MVWHFGLVYAFFRLHAKTRVQGFYWLGIGFAIIAVSVVVSRLLFTILGSFDSAEQARLWQASIGAVNVVGMAFGAMGLASLLRETRLSARLGEEA